MERAPWFPLSTVEKMLKVLKSFDPRIIIDSDFIYDVSLAKSLANCILTNEDKTELKKPFYKLYCGLVDAYNREVSKHNRQMNAT